MSNRANDIANDVRVRATAQIIAAYVKSNVVVPSELPLLIARVNSILHNVPISPIKKLERLSPPVPIRETVKRNYIISLEDGKRYKTLKLHLALRGLSPDAYRAKWGLPANYPMVAPSYSTLRSEYAKKIGLGGKPDPKTRMRTRNA